MTLDLVSFVSARYSQGPPSGNLLQYCCLRALFGAHVVPCCGMVSGALFAVFCFKFYLRPPFLNNFHAGPFTFSADSTSYVTFLTIILFVFAH